MTSDAGADAFDREVDLRLPALRDWLGTVTQPGAAGDPAGLAEALSTAHALADGAAVAGRTTPAAFLRAAEIALSGAERPDRGSYELARARRLVERAAVALAIVPQPSGARERAEAARAE